MEHRFSFAVEAFEQAITRAQQMVALFDALEAIRPDNIANGDALRAAYIQAVSSFDFFAHEIAIVETEFRLIHNIRVRNVNVPMNILSLDNEEKRLEAARAEFRKMNSYKAFGDPGKLGEMLSCYTEKPWKCITACYNEIYQSDKSLDERELKLQLRQIWRRRNQIAHEADVNPALAGIALWPIDKNDAIFSIEFVLRLGKILPLVISMALPEGEEAVEE